MSRPLPKNIATFVAPSVQKTSVKQCLLQRSNLPEGSAYTFALLFELSIGIRGYSRLFAAIGGYSRFRLMSPAPYLDHIRNITGRSVEPPGRKLHPSPFNSSQLHQKPY
jgi:hypothetical protein